MTGGLILSCLPAPLCFSSGCPVVPNHRKTIKWYFQNQTLEEAQGPRHRMLVGGRVLEVNTLHGRFDGLYRCQTQMDTQLLSAWVQISVEGMCLCALPTHPTLPSVQPGSDQSAH